MASMRARLLLSLTGALLAGLAGCTPDPLAVVPMPARETRWCAQLLDQLNDYRDQRGLPPLVPHEGLTQLSLSHCDWLLEKQGSSFLSGSHVSHSGSHWRNRAARARFGMQAWGENVAYTAHTPEHVAHHLLLMWQTSPPHHRLLLGDWSHAGMAMRIDQRDAIFATLTFGRLQDEPAAP